AVALGQRRRGAGRPVGRRGAGHRGAPWRRPRRARPPATKANGPGRSRQAFVKPTTKRGLSSVHGGTALVLGNASCRAGGENCAEGGVGPSPVWTVLA